MFATLAPRATCQRSSTDSLDQRGVEISRTIHCASAIRRRAARSGTRRRRVHRLPRHRVRDGEHGRWQGPPLEHDAGTSMAGVRRADVYTNDEFPPHPSFAIADLRAMCSHTSHTAPRARLCPISVSANSINDPCKAACMPCRAAALPRRIDDTHVDLLQAARHSQIPARCDRRGLACRTKRYRSPAQVALPDARIAALHKMCLVFVCWSSLP